MAREIIDASKAEAEFGIRCHHERMDNSELRFRLIGSDGNAYIRTVTEVGGWQRSHRHRSTYETYVVEAGWMAFATLGDDHAPLHLEIFKCGEVFTTPLNVAHNVYLPAGATIHTVKHGSHVNDADWWGCTELDALTANLTEDDINARTSAV